jgi:uncharacterized protein
VDLTLQRPGDHLWIRAVTSAGIQVGEAWYRQSLILSSEQLITDWAVESFNDLSESLLEPVVELKPDIVLVGTGARQQFLPAELMMVFFRRGIGAEVMTTDAACRTFNVLVSEGRQVVAALIQPGAELPR